MNIRELNSEIYERFKRTVTMNNAELESTIRNLFDLHQDDLIDDRGHRLGINPIVKTVGLTRKPYYEAISSYTSPSKATLIKLAFAFNFSAEELVDLMYYNGYVFPALASIEDELVIIAFELGVTELDYIDNILSQYVKKPCYHFTTEVLNQQAA